MTHNSIQALLAVYAAANELQVLKHNGMPITPDAWGRLRKLCLEASVAMEAEDETP